MNIKDIIEYIDELLEEFEEFEYGDTALGDAITMLKQGEKRKQILENLKYEMNRRGNKECLDYILYLEQKYFPKEKNDTIPR